MYGRGNSRIMERVVELRMRPLLAYNCKRNELHFFCGCWSKGMRMLLRLVLGWLQALGDLKVRSCCSGQQKTTHHNVSLRSGKDLSLETEKLLMSHWFVDIDVKCANTNSNELVMDFSTPNKSIVLKIQEPWLAIIFKSSIEIYCPSGLFSSILVVMITLTTQIWKKENKVVILSRVIGIITREFYTIKFGFEVLGDNVKVFHKQGWHCRG